MSDDAPYPLCPKPDCKMPRRPMGLLCLAHEIEESAAWNHVTVSMAVNDPSLEPWRVASAVTFKRGDVIAFEGTAITGDPIPSDRVGLHMLAVCGHVEAAVRLTWQEWWASQ